MAFRRRIGDTNNVQTTYIAKDSNLTGKLTGKGSYVFCGRMDGDCDIDGPVTLADTGNWHGTLKATDVIIAGNVEGDVIAAKRVEVAGTARVSGSLSGHSIAVAEGAVIEGEIKVMSGESPVRFEEKRTRGTAADSSAA